MPTRWEVEEKVLASSIEPGGRHILLTLLSRSTAATAEIPSKHLPTFDDLESMTGLARSTLIEWMKTLTDSKWIVREVLEGEKREGMRVLIGDLRAERIKRVRKSKKSDASYRVAVQTEGASEGVDVPPRGTGRTATRYADVPPRGMDEEGHLIKNSPTESFNHVDRDQSAASADDAGDGALAVDFGPRTKTPPKQRAAKKAEQKTAPKNETAGQRLNRVTKLYTDHVKPSHFFKAKAVVESAFDANFSEEQICAGIAKLVEKKDPLSKDSIRIAIQGPPSWADRNLNAGRTGYVRMTDSHNPDRDYEESY